VVGCEGSGARVTVSLGNRGFSYCFRKGKGEKVRKP